VLTGLRGGGSHVNAGLLDATILETLEAQEPQKTVFAPQNSVREGMQSLQLGGVT
jgi:hypothetical protein